MGSQAYFTPGLFQFLKDLKSHNNRDWFEKDTPRYEAEEFSERDICARDFLERYVAVCRRTTPLMEFLTKALGMPWPAADRLVFIQEVLR